MSVDRTSNDEYETDRIKIFATDDEKIKLFGELFANDSSRRILQLLFGKELTATQIARETDISLQLVKYHLIKLQRLEVVRITKTEKNSKSQDMKIYSATKSSIVIVPPNISEKAKESKLLVRSFKHIYKVVGLGVATGVSGIFSLSTLRQDIQTPTKDTDTFDQMLSSEESSKNFQDAKLVERGEPAPDESLSASTGAAAKDRDSSLLEPASDENWSASTLAEESENASKMDVEFMLSYDSAILSNADLFIPLIVITAVFAGFTGYYLWRFLKRSR